MTGQLKKVLIIPQIVFVFHWVKNIYLDKPLEILIVAQ